MNPQDLEDRIERLRVWANRLKSLLDTPELGLLSWHAMVDESIYQINETVEGR